MGCPRCGGEMTYGAPHCETIRTQQECRNCGHYVCEYYTPQELAANELMAEGYHAQEARKAVAQAGGDIKLAVKILKRQYNAQGY